MISPTAQDFDMHSTVHGLEHTQRVMHLVKHLGRVGKLNPKHILQAYCAAVIHDMARQHDGACQMHGQWAVERKLPIWQERFLAIGLPKQHLPAVAFAVHWHCMDFRIVPNSSFKPALQLLQDADALDRVRFGGASAIDLSYLHFSFTKLEIGYAEQLLFGW
jgi:hypothetical protein